MYIGCHLSASKGYKAMGKQAIELGANTFAFFTRNPRGGSAKEIDIKDVEAFLKLAEENNFGKLVAHAPYTMNACAEKENIRQFAIEMLADDLRRMEYTPGNYYNFHPGNHVGQGSEKGIELISEILNEIMGQERFDEAMFIKQMQELMQMKKEYETPLVMLLWISEDAVRCSEGAQEDIFGNGDWN